MDIHLSSCSTTITFLRGILISTIFQAFVPERLFNEHGSQKIVLLSTTNACTFNGFLQSSHKKQVLCETLFEPNLTNSSFSCTFCRHLMQRGRTISKHSIQ
uniref:Uncharacterized protein n=1 Tax=Romanomermis culicivorax TaxID=13658 RepID=A0A915KRX5_ROMCU